MRLVWGQRPLTGCVNRPMQARRHHGVWHFAYGARKGEGSLTSKFSATRTRAQVGPGPCVGEGLST